MLWLLLCGLWSKNTWYLLPSWNIFRDRDFCHCRNSGFISSPQWGHWRFLLHWVSFRNAVIVFWQVQVDLCTWSPRCRRLLDFKPARTLCLPEFSSPSLEHWDWLLPFEIVDHFGFRFRTLQDVSFWCQFCVLYLYFFHFSYICG